MTVTDGRRRVAAPDHGARSDHETAGSSKVEASSSCASVDVLRHRCETCDGTSEGAMRRSHVVACVALATAMLGLASPADASATGDVAGTLPAERRLHLGDLVPRGGCRRQRERCHRARGRGGVPGHRGRLHECGRPSASPSPPTRPRTPARSRRRGPRGRRPSSPTRTTGRSSCHGLTATPASTRSRSPEPQRVERAAMGSRRSTATSSSRPSRTPGAPTTRRSTHSMRAPA